MDFRNILLETTAEKFVELIRDKGMRNPLNGRQTIIDDVVFELVPRGSMVNLKDIRAMTKGAGIGTKFMNMLVDAADKYSVSLELDAVPYEQRDRKDSSKLISWYKKFGFEDRGEGYMIRRPKFGNKIIKLKGFNQEQ